LIDRAQQRRPATPNPSALPAFGGPGAKDFPIPYPLPYLAIRIAGFVVLKKWVRKYKAVDDTNRANVLKMKSPRMLLGRTLIVVARKPDKAASFSPLKTTNLSCSE